MGRELFDRMALGGGAYSRKYGITTAIAGYDAGKEFFVVSYLFFRYFQPAKGFQSKRHAHVLRFLRVPGAHGLLRVLSSDTKQQQQQQQQQQATSSVFF